MYEILAGIFGVIIVFYLGYVAGTVLTLKGIERSRDYRPALPRGGSGTTHHRGKS